MPAQRQACKTLLLVLETHQILREKKLLKGENTFCFNNRCKQNGKYTRYSNIQKERGIRSP